MNLDPKFKIVEEGTPFNSVQLISLGYATNTITPSGSAEEVEINGELYFKYNYTGQTISSSVAYLGSDNKLYTKRNFCTFTIVGDDSDYIKLSYTPTYGSLIILQPMSNTAYIIFAYEEINSAQVFKYNLRIVPSPSEVDIYETFDFN